MSVLLALVGGGIVVVTLLDAANTLVSTRLRVGRLWPTEIFYRAIWPLWRRLGRLRDEDRRESFLSLFAPLSLIGLLVLWVITEILGWSLVWWALRESFDAPLVTPVDAIYFSGITFFSVGFGDLAPLGGGARFLAILEAFGGLGTMALVIGYLPALYSAYSARETQLLMLDDLTGERIMPITLIEAYARDGRTDDLYAFYREWERWSAQVLETHTSYPMLAFFRSQHLGQSWITAGGVVLDSATLCVACIERADEQAPMFLYRRGNRLLHHFAQRFGLPGGEPPDADRERFDLAYERMAARGLPLRDADEAFARLVELRRDYAAELERLIDEFLAPRGFWSHRISGRPERYGTDRPEEAAPLADVAHRGREQDEDWPDDVSSTDQAEPPDRPEDED